MKPLRRSFGGRIIGWMLILATAYLVFIGALGVMQRKLMYFPDPKPFVPSAWALKELKPFPVTSGDGLKLTSWYLPAKQRGKFTVVFFQGNAGHLGYRNYKVRPWIDNGYGVLMVGFRGFGNPGSPSEQGYYQDARANINALLETGVPISGVVLYGESMGTGVAVQMATEFKAAALILEAPYTSVPDVAAHRYPLVPVHWLLTDTYNSLGKIADINMPLLLMHGLSDYVVPAKFGHELFAAAVEPKQGEFILGVGHNDVYDLRIQQLVLQFIGNLPNELLLNALPKAQR